MAMTVANDSDRLITSYELPITDSHFRLPTGIYLHIPFCRSRCSYCDFNTYVGLNDLFEPYVHALRREIERGSTGAGAGAQAHTIFFGGGTPSLLRPEWIGDLIHTCRASFEMPADCEITVECNPGTVDVDYLRRLRQQGVNRLSFGAQSADPGELKLLGREHGFADVVEALQAARQAGFDNVNLDLIFGLPYQSLDTWRRTLDATLVLQPDHISLYALTVEHGTPMHDWVRRGEVPCGPGRCRRYVRPRGTEHGRSRLHALRDFELVPPQSRVCAQSDLLAQPALLRLWCRGALIVHPAALVERAPPCRLRRTHPARRVCGDGTRGHRRVHLTGRDDDDGAAPAERGRSAGALLQRYGAPMEHFYSSALREGQRLGLLDVDDERVILTQRGHF